MHSSSFRKPKTLALVLCLFLLLIAGAAAAPGSGAIPQPSRLDGATNDQAPGMHSAAASKTTLAAGFRDQGTRTGTGTWSFEWSEPGTTGVNLPWGVTTDNAGNIYAADNSDNTIWKFDPDGTLITRWGSTGTGNGQFDTPTDIAVNKSGYIYVAEWGNNRVQVFDSSGTYLRQWGSAGTGNGQFSSPTGIAVNDNGNVFVTDTLNSRVQEFSPSGEYITQWGGWGYGSGSFSYPTGIAVNRLGLPLRSGLRVWPHRGVQS